jgi:hypothetical protein
MIVWDEKFSAVNYLVASNNAFCHRACAKILAKHWSRSIASIPKKISRTVPHIDVRISSQNVEIAAINCVEIPKNGRMLIKKFCHQS